MAQERKSSPSQQVRDVMTANPKTVTDSDSVLDVARIMRDSNTGVVPVVNGKKIIGLVTDRDIVVRVLADGKDIKNARVNDVMTKQVRTVNEDASVSEVLDLMSGAQIRRIPVVNRNNELVGIVSMKDIAVETHQDNRVGKTVENISKGPANN